MRNETVHTEEYKGYTIEIYPDDWPENPFEAWDCEPPIAVHYDRDISCYATKYGDPLRPPELTREQVKANTRQICDMLGAGSLLEAADRLNELYSFSAVEQINYVLRRRLGELNNSDRLEALAELWNMAGIPAIVRVSRGYCQGDYAEVLAVATPEFQKACGNDPDYWNGPDGIKNLEASIKLYGYWAWGDVYGYVVRTPDGERDDSCWGYYGKSDDEYMLSEARSHIDYVVEKARKARIEQLKTWIRNRVPLQYRMFA